MSAALANADVEAPGTTHRVRRRIAAAVIGVVLVGVGVALTGPPTDAFPLDPRSAADDGLLGVVELLGELGVSVEVSARVPADTSTRVLVPVDQMTGERRRELVRFAEDGGTVVVAGASPDIHGLERQEASLVGALGRTARTADCAALDEVDEVYQAQWATLEVPPGATACFRITAGNAWLVAVPTGAGTIVGLGSAEPLTNGLLAEADNAVLAVSLLGPEPGDRVRIVPRAEVGEGDTPLAELIPPGFVRAAWLLLAAVLAAVSWRARRLGQPVEERLPPVLPSAELARSVADLLQRAGDRTAAAGRIRQDARRTVSHALGLPVGTPSVRMVELLPQRSGVAADDARRVLLDAPVTDDRSLTELGAAAGRIRAELRRPAPATSLSDDP